MLDSATDQGLPHLIARRWRTMGVTFALVFLAGTVTLQVLPKTYEASAKLLVMHTDQRLGGLNVVNDTLPELAVSSNPLFTQVELLQIEPVLQSVIDKLGLKDEKGQPMAAEDLARKVKVEPVGKTDLIAVSYRSRNRVLAQQVVASICEAYLKQTEQYRQDGVKDGLKYVDKQLEAAHKRLLAAEDKLLDFKQRANSVALAEEVQASVTEVSTLNGEVRARQIDLARARARAAALRQQLGMSPRAAMQAVAIAQSPRIKELQAELAAAESAPIRSQGLGANHPDMLASDQHIAELKAAIAREVRQVAGSGAPSATLDDVRVGLLRELAECEAEIQASSSGYRTAESRRSALVSSMARFPSQQITLGRLSREVDVDGQIYQQLLQKREEARLNMAIAPTYARIVDPPALPAQPLQPLKGLGFPILGLAGLASGFLAGALKDLLDRRMRPEDLANNVPELKIYAALPLLPWSERRNGELVVQSGTNPYYIEGLRGLGMALEEHCGSDQGRCIAITSMQAREGKSVTLANLALCLADAGQRVLLVDCDFRRPRVHELFGFEFAGVGLSEVLLERARPLEAIQSAGTIDVVTAGSSKFSSSLAKLKLRLGPAIEAWKEEYDFVLLDLPPMLLLAEVAHAAKHTDALLMLTNLQQAAPDALVAGVRQLQSLRVPVAGIIAISQLLGKPKKGGYYLVAGEGLIS